MQLTLIGTTVLKDKKQVPLFRLVKFLMVDAAHIETVEFSYPPETTDSEIAASLPEKIVDIKEQHAALIADGWLWHQYEQKWHKG